MQSRTSTRFDIKAARKRHRYIDIIPDRHGGAPRSYFLRNGKRTPLPREFESADWFLAYAACRAGQPLPERTKPAIEKVKRGSFEAMIRAYMATPKFQNFKQQKNRIISFNKLRALDLGDVEVAAMTKKQIVEMINRLALTKPGAARDLQAALNCIYEQAVLHELIAANPILGMKRPELKAGGGRFSWEEEHVAQYRRCHALGTVARLALEVMLNTALRCSDACRVGPGTGTIRNGVIVLTQRKLERFGERAQVEIPIHPDLRVALDAMPVVGQRTWLFSVTGKAFPDGDTLSGSFAKWCDEAGLPTKCRAHGLRKACAKRLIDAGVNPADASTITGHLDLKELMFYAAARDRRIGAARAMAAIS